jgi:hypothetical protein
MQINDAVSICHKKGINIYPEFKKGYWYIVKEQPGKKPLYGKTPHTLAAINKQKNHILSNAYIYYANLESI